MSDGQPQVGDVISERYRLVEEIGRGGFGVVYKAVQLGMERDVAIKMLHPVGDDGMRAQMRERFKREAMMARNLNHPHTIRQYDFGETEAGLMYLVLEYLDGQNLVEIIREHGALGEDRVRRMASGALKALSEAHAQGIVHRDLKPANIMLCNVYGESDYVKVLDFGIAKTMVGDTDLTAAGVALGSPRYMAPELLKGDKPSPAADVYAIAITFGEAIIGKPILDVENSVEAAQAQLSPEPLKVPGELEVSAMWPWLKVAMQKEIGDRFKDAEEMLQYLDASPEELAAFSAKGSTATTSPLEPISGVDETMEYEGEDDDVDDAPTQMVGGDSLAFLDEEPQEVPSPSLPKPSLPKPEVPSLSPPKIDLGAMEDEHTAPVDTQEANVVAVAEDDEYDDDAPTQMVGAEALAFLDDPQTPQPAVQHTPAPGVNAPVSQPVQVPAFGGQPGVIQGNVPTLTESPAIAGPGADHGIGIGQPDEGATEMVDISGGIPPATDAPRPVMNTPAQPAASVQPASSVGSLPTPNAPIGTATSNRPVMNTPMGLQNQMPVQPFQGSTDGKTDYIEFDINQMAPEQKKARNKWAVILVVMLFFGLGGMAAVGGTLYYLSNKQKEAEPVAIPTIEEPKEKAEVAASRTFRIYSVPEGAAIMIEGKEKGKTPARFKADSADLPKSGTLKLAGFKPYEFKLTADGEDFFDVELTPDPTAAKVEEKPKTTKREDPKPKSDDPPKKKKKKKKKKEEKPSDDLIPLFD